MNRPKKEDYVIHYSFIYGSWDEFDKDGYQEDLEKYANQLEEAFDKSCEMLEGLFTAIAILTGRDNPHKKETLKEWCMKDE